VTCGACGTEYVVSLHGRDLVLSPVLSGEARVVGEPEEQTRGARERLGREIDRLRQLMVLAEAEGQRGLSSRYNLARLGTVVLAIGLAFRFLLRQQSPLVLAVALVGAMTLVAALSSIKGLTDAMRTARKLRQEAIDHKERELAQLRDLLN
jgi:hypothetical protein